MALLVLLTGCSSEDVDDTTTSVSAQLAFAVSKVSTPTTRQGDDVVQATTTSARVIQLTRIIPFGLPINGEKITSGDIPKSMVESSATSQHWYDRTKERFFLSTGVLMTPGTAAFLVYGRAVPMAGDAVNGALVASYAESNPSDISFGLKQIRPSTEAPDDAEAIAAYLNRIANAQAVIGGTTYSWKNSTNSLLKVLYRNFTTQNQDFGVATKWAGSSASVRKYVENLRFTLNNQSEHFLDDATATAIKDAIIAQIDNNADFPANYPGSIGLPDGSAVLLWTADGFEPQVETTTEVAINSIDRYCYPAELYYHSNSLIKTSDSDIVNEDYNDVNINTWDDLLKKYTSGTVVMANTQAAAIVDPLQYAVACLQVTLKKVDATLKDCQNQDVKVTEKAFPLTGIIVGGQYTVDFDFKPATPLSPDRFIYDSQVMTKTNDYHYLSTTVEESAPTHTLVLQSNESDTPVTVVLEFQNNSDTDFYGVNNGIIYRGTKFYMIAKVSRPTQTEGIKDYEKRVFTQDYTTTLPVRIASLKEAYNVLPDLLSPNLEVGIQITSKWVQSTSTTVVL